MFSLEGKKILVTGASSGIGKATAIMFAANGATLIITGRDEQKLNAVLTQLDDQKHRAITCDLSDEEALKKLADSVDQIDGLVYSAGVIDYTLYKNLNREKYDKIFNVNFYSAIQLTNYLLKFKKIEKGSSLVYISSISSILGVPATALYGASKAALNTAVKVLASELAPRKIRANTVMPGIVRTPMITEAEGLIESEAFDLAEKQYPLGFGTPDDVASACLFLTSDASKWITGTSILLDGGHNLL
ncbi:SDR family oxidoreductase [Pedobacter sp. HDW13]|uniref:SDR family NAD(P)-dependent oxidoreductase n=1 Tax=Pedobacter sp. HDW13 TaxID=2714940 RepID=UPI00140C1BDC|nr:SDR family oxidoreductase [Pedobacter sp. HDW13]QIL39198.1 SDR family oxidoreductase [Pedobacter sp. HDW13]